MVVDLLLVRLDGLQQFASQLLLVLQGVIGEEECESEGSEVGDGAGGGLLVQYLVEGVDGGFEGGVGANECQQL